MKGNDPSSFRVFLLIFSIWGFFCLIPGNAAALTVTPSTWNIIGLDSNTPATGPNRFPVGAKVCGGVSGNTTTATFTWDTGGTDNGTYIYLRSGSPASVGITFDGDGCADAYFNVEVAKDANAFDETRRYYITAGGVSTPTPRELYVERLISQSRNSITDVKLDGISIPPGGAMNLVVGNTYTIDLVGGTATQGYNQFEAFINMPNTIFQINSVTTDYSANDSPYVASLNHEYLYADACLWDDDPNSPYYSSCVGGDYKAGGSNVVTTYVVTILGGGGSSQTLNTLLYDFSGSSFHYNADFSTGARIANIIDPTSLTISKNFGPDPTNVGGVSALTFTISNPNTATVSGLNFVDNLPTSPGAMVVADPPSATASGCGTPTFAPVAGDASLSFFGGTVAAAGNCIVKVNVTMPATGTYNNDSENLFIDAVDTTDDALASLVVNTAPAPSPPVCGLELARWDMGTGTTPLPPVAVKATNVATATASFAGATDSIETSPGNPGSSWESTGYSKTTVPSSATSPYYQLEVDSSNYTNVTVQYDSYATNSWVTSNFTYGWSSADGGAYTATTPATNALVKATWVTGDAMAAATTGTTTTAFRINAMGANSTGAAMNLDNIVITGCAVPDPPSLTKSFSLDPVAVNGVATLTFTLTNPNTIPLTGAEFLDSLPTGLEVAATPNASTTCTGSPTWAPAATETALAFGQVTGATIPASGSCTVSVDIKATTAGPHNNVSGFISATESGVNDTASGIATASLFAVSPPSISKVFGTNPILAGGSSTLTFSITNPNQNNDLSGVAFSDIFPTSPGNMVVAATPNAVSSGCGGTEVFTAVAAAGSVSFSNGTIAAGGTCTVSVDITAPTASVTTYDNTSSTVSHILNSATFTNNTASDSLLVNPASPQVSILKQVSKTGVAGSWGPYVAVAAGDPIYYKFTVENPGDVALTNVSVSDPDAILSSCSWASVAKYETVACTGTATAVAGEKVNTATAIGTYNSVDYTDTSQATYATTGVALVKSVAERYFVPGGTVNYSYVVSNTGSAVLGDAATVADDKTTVTCPSYTTAVLTSDGVTAGDGDNYLDPGEQITCSAAYTVVVADVTAKLITNIATATISGVVSNSDTVTVPLASDLIAVKTNSVGGTILQGNSFDWTILVSNSTNAGSAAVFEDTQLLLKDELPTSGATYTLGTVSTAGTTGTINCGIISNILTCTASGTVAIPVALSGTIAVAKDSAAVVGTGTAFTSELTAGSVISIDGVSYTVSAVTNDTNLTLVANYAGATAAGLAIPGSFSVLTTVTTTAGGSLVNPTSGGICRVDSGTVLTEIDETNNDCADTVTVTSLVSLTVVKSVQPFSDPINNTTGPKAIPGAFMDYTILVTNTGLGTADNDSTVMIDPVPANTELFVGDITGVADTGPVLFTDGATASGLSYTFTALNDLADGPSFSADGADYSKADVTADANQCDPTVTHLKVSLGGVFAASDGTNHPSFTLKFRVRVE